MQGKSFWYGREVEGRLTGLLTCFVRDCIPQESKLPKGVCHFYFTREFMEVEAKWLVISTMLDSNILVTCEVNEDIMDSLPDNIRIRAHLIYRVKTPSVYLLKSTDSVALDLAPYEVRISTLHQFQEVKPHEYTHDFERTT